MAAITSICSNKKPTKSQKKEKKQNNSSFDSDNCNFREESMEEKTDYREY
jgi:hypothetical protein